MPRLRLVFHFTPVLFVMLGVACTPDKGEGEVEEEEVIDEDGDGVIAEEDCDDSRSWVYPGAAETCDGIDNDCDGDVDEELNRVFYIDNDGDGYGDETNAVEACEAPSGAVSDATDCDDAEADIYPGATESCDDLDNDCDGSIDEDVTGIFYDDADSDGYGDPDTAETICEAGKTQVENGLDCDDTNEEVHPAASEICDEIDNDCDELVDDQDAIDDPDAPTWYADADDDNSGNPDSTRVACEEPEGFVDNADDCDDTDRMIKPDGLEVCDDVDNDCDELIDIDDDSLDLGTALEAYPDLDGDGYGDDSRAEWVCDFDPRKVYDGGDCDDRDDTVYDGADEICDELDNDCDGDVDEDDVCDETASGDWTAYTGTETFDYSTGGAFGDRNCELVWTMSGTPSSALGCTDCEFVFDIEAKYRRPLSTDDGSCTAMAIDRSFSYGYVEDYYGYGSYLMYYSPIYGSFSAVTSATFDDSTGELEYSYGYEDMEYYGSGIYYTYHLAGEAELTAEEE